MTVAIFPTNYIEKLSPINADLLFISDSEDLSKWKYIQIWNLPVSLIDLQDVFDNWQSITLYNWQDKTLDIINLDTINNQTSVKIDNQNNWNCLELKTIWSWIPLLVTQDYLISTNFRKVFQEYNTSVTIWISDWTSPNWTLSWTIWDICLNWWSWNCYRCTWWTSWTAM